MDLKKSIIVSKGFCPGVKGNINSFDKAELLWSWKREEDPKGQDNSWKKKTLSLRRCDKRTGRNVKGA